MLAYSLLVIARVVSLVVFSFIMLGLNPVFVSAEGTLSHALFLPSVTVEEELQQMRSCSGKFKILPVGNLSALSEECVGGSAYPDLVQTNQGVAFSGLVMDGWYIVPHVGEFAGREEQFKVTVGDHAPYLTVAFRQGALSISRGDEIFILSDQAVDVDGWAMTVHNEGTPPYVQFEKGSSKIWVVLVDKFFWIEGQIPKDTEELSAWQEAITNNGELSDAVEFEQHIIARYTFGN